MNIDLVVPYVDSEDPNWQKLFNKYNPIQGEEIEGINAKNRFRGQGDFFKYWFRCVEQNMPWINNIFLIVQSDSQVPNWLNRDKITIVYHEDFIPKEYLPTFNSTCIEMFLWNIPNLSEKFLYANDDSYSIRYLKEEWFFDNNKVRNRTVGIKDKHSVYGNHCLNSYCLAYNLDTKDIVGIYPGLEHTIRPYLKEEIKNAFILNKNYILNSISAFREEKNINIYYFDHYLIKNHLQSVKLEPKTIVLSSSTSDKDKLMMLNDYNVKIVGVQDTDPNIDIYENGTLRNWFDRNYPMKSKYEV